MVIPDIEVMRCDRSTVSLHSLLCGNRVSLVDVGSAGFPACREATRVYASDPAFDGLQARGLNIVQIFSTDESFQPATSLFCERYTEQFGVDFEFLIDPLGNSDVLGYLHPLNLVTDPQAKVVYKWEGEVPGDRVAKIEAILDQSPAP